MLFNPWKKLKLLRLEHRELKREYYILSRKSIEIGEGYGPALDNIYCYILRLGKTFNNCKIEGLVDFLRVNFVAKLDKMDTEFIQRLESLLEQKQYDEVKLEVDIYMKDYKIKKIRTLLLDSSISSLELDTNIGKKSIKEIDRKLLEKTGTGLKKDRLRHAVKKE